MICEKCNRQVQHGNHCSNCANPLREICSECRKMEWIGKSRCETRQKENEDRLKEIHNQRIPKSEKIIATVSWFVFAMIFFGSCTVALVMIITKTAVHGYLMLEVSALVAWFMLGGYALYHLQYWILSRAEKKFWRKNPELKVEWDKLREGLSKKEALKK